MEVRKAFSMFTYVTARVPQLQVICQCGRQSSPQRHSIREIWDHGRMNAGSTPQPFIAGSHLLACVYSKANLKRPPNGDFTGRLLSFRQKPTLFAESAGQRQSHYGSPSLEYLIYFGRPHGRCKL